MSTSIAVYPRAGTEYLDANNVPITSAGAIVPVSAYIDDALRRGDVSTSDPLDVYDPEDRTGVIPGLFAPVNAEYLVAAANATLTNDRVLQAGTGITLTPGAGTLTVASTAGGAPSNAGYIVTALDAALSNERRLVGGSGINIVDGGPGGDLTISAPGGGGGGGAPTDAKYVVWGADATLSNEREFFVGQGLGVDIATPGQLQLTSTIYDASYVVLAPHASMPNERALTAGAGIAIADGGPGGAVTISTTGGGGGGAPTTAQYVTLATDAGLSAERVLAAGTGISIVDGGAGGNVTINNTGAPVNAEYLVATANGTLSAERVLTAGANISLTPGAGILTIAASGGGGGASGFLNVLDNGVVSGALGNNTARSNNRIAFNNAINLAASTNKILVVPPGTYEIHGGAVIVSHEQFRWLGTTSSIILQYQLNAPVLHVGGALGSASIIFSTQIDGAFLRYAGNATAGGNALECVGLYMCELKNFLIGDPYAAVINATSVPWIGVYIDQLPGTVPSFSNKFENFHIKHHAYIGWSQFRDDYSAASGNHYSNIYIGNGDNTGTRDLTVTNGYAAYFGSLGQSVFNQFNVEWVTASRPIHLEVCGETVFNSLNLEGITLKATSLQNLALFALFIGEISINGVTVNNCTFNTANNVNEPAIFHAAQSSRFSVTNLRVMLNNKTASNFAVIRQLGADQVDVHMNLENLILGDGDLLDLVDAITFTAGSEGPGFGLLTDFNNSAVVTTSDTSHTRYAYRTPGIILVPATSARTLTLARACSSTITARIPRGVLRRVKASSSSTVQVSNYNAATLGSPIAAGSFADFVFNGTDWIRL